MGITDAHGTGSLTEISGDETVLPDASPETVLPNGDEAETVLSQVGGEGQSEGASRRAIAVGDILWNGRYRIDAAVEGGMEAAAYRGTRQEDGLQVFVKHQWRRKSKHRASILEKLLACDHPGCVRLLDFDVTDRPIEIYEWVDGIPLSTVLRRDLTFSEQQTRFIVRELADALHYLHEHAGTAHRDLKPANVMLTDPGPPMLKIADYGVMTLVAAGGATTFAGTKKYAPPEALRWSLPRDSDLIAYDWWSLGRLVQEIVDGVHPYDRVASLFPDMASDPEALEAVWAELLSEEKRATYGRAGQVEHSAAAWRPLLRGLLTADREKRWGYAETVRWLDGESVPDFYDAVVSGPQYGSAADDVVPELLRLSTPENWAEVCRLVAESDGVFGYIRRKSDNKRAQARLREADAVYDAVVESGGGDVAEEVFATLALRAVGGERVPMTLRGYQLDPHLLLEWSRTGARNISKLLLAFMRADVIRLVEMTKTLQGWNAKTTVLDQTAAVACIAAESREQNESQIENARRFLASSSIRGVQAAFTNPKRTDAEAAALVFTFERAAEFGYETVATVERREREAREAEESERRRLEHVRRAAAERAEAEQRRRDEAEREGLEQLRKENLKKVRDIAVVGGGLFGGFALLLFFGLAKPAPTTYVPPQQYVPQTPTFTSADEVSFVENYYRLWNQHDFATMYGMLSTGMQARHPYADYVKYHTNVVEIGADARVGSIANVVAVTIRSRDREVDGSISENTNAGDWYLSVENGALKLESQTIHPVGSQLLPRPVAARMRTKVAPAGTTYSAPRHASIARPRSATKPVKSVNQLDKEIDP
jgi:Protein kinase domain